MTQLPSTTPTEEKDEDVSDTVHKERILYLQVL